MSKERNCIVDIMRGMAILMVVANASVYTNKWLCYEIQQRYRQRVKSLELHKKTYSCLSSALGSLELSCTWDYKRKS